MIRWEGSWLSQFFCIRVGILGLNQFWQLDLMVHLFTQTIISTSYNKTISNFCFSVAQAVELLNLLAGVILSLTFVRFGLALMTHYRPVKFVTDKWKFRAMTAIITSNNKKNTILPWLWLNAILLCNKISAQFFFLILIVTYFFFICYCSYLVSCA